MTERWYFGEDPVSSVFAGDVRLYPTTPPQEQIEFPIIIDGAIYQNDDLHVFASNGKDVKWPSKKTPIFVAVNGYEATDYDNPTVEPGDRIYALFDWDNSDFDLENFDYEKPEESNVQDWFYDILQIGSVASLASSDGSDITQPRQLANGNFAFAGMTANPKVIADLDISSITTMQGMFALSKFDVDISGWNTENITNMDEMFFMSTQFNHNLGNWKVENVELIVRPELSEELNQEITIEEPVGFDAGAFNWRSPRPPFTLREQIKEWFTGFPITIEGVTYTEEDAHMMVTVHGTPLGFYLMPTTNTKLLVHNGEVKRIEQQSGEDLGIDLGYHLFNTFVFIGDWGGITLDSSHSYSYMKIGSRSVGGEPEGYVNPPALPSGRIPNQLKTGEKAFYGAKFGINLPNQDLDVSNLTNMNSMFDSSAVYAGDISGWDTSNVTDMSSMFSDARFREELNWDISSWDTSNVTDMKYMFYSAGYFNSDISDWNTSKVSNMN